MTKDELANSALIELPSALIELPSALADGQKVSLKKALAEFLKK